MSFLMMALAGLLTPFLAAQPLDPNQPQVIEHAQLRTFENHGNALTGIATPFLGATDCEVWHSSIAAHSCTPLHQHESQEIFIFLKGEGKALVGDQEIFFEAPCTLLLTAHIPHQIFNIGDEPSDQIVILKSNTAIYKTDGSLMELPWRR
jgi:mannose-6-phosphate isomerase-like protein (cupin superfamily)